MATRAFYPQLDDEDDLAPPPDVFMPNIPSGMPDENGHYEFNRSRSNAPYMPPPTGSTIEGTREYQDFNTVGNKLSAAYSAPHAGMLRQVLGAIISKRNPGLGGIVSGEAQRQRKIEPLQQQYGLLSDIISKNRAQQSANITDKLHAAQTEFYGPKTQALLNPPPKQTPTEQAVEYYMTQVDPATKKPYTPASALKQVNQDAQDVKPDAGEASHNTVTIGDRVKQWNPSTSKYDIDVGPSGKTEPPAQNAPRTMVAVPRPDGSSKVMEVKPGSTIPKGAMTVSQEGGLSKPGKPTADEQRRADLAENLNENLDKLDEITTRRPELFGPVSGRVTALKGFVGSNDPDIGTLETIKHQIGMAQISAHGMRSAHGIEGASQSILNSFKNGPDAVRASTKAARDSVKTFTQDVERAKNPNASSTGKEIRYKIVNGELVPQQAQATQ